VAELLPCDLVMKGGITSGVVYPAAIKRLSEKYVFRNVGGASAGAIAAVIAAACEFNRRDHSAEDAFEALDAVNAELTQPHFIQSLFQPTPEARPTFEALLALQAGKGTAVASKVVSALKVLARRSPGAVAIVLAAVALWVAFVVVSVVALAAGGVTTLEIVAFVLLAGVSVVALAVLVAAGVAAALAHLVGDLNAGLMTNGFGMCSGKELTQWLHEKTQQCAGLPLDEPLTFADLKGKPEDEESAIALQLVTTDLSASRPVDLPLPDTDEATVYFFKDSELDALLPDPVLKAIRKHRVEFVEGGDVYFRMPGSAMPVVLAARLSLSFPILLSTVPLYSKGADGREVRHTMSDGGISSNFPIHFFDMLLPRWPTFGLDLQPYPDPKQTGPKPPDVVFGPEPRAPLFTAVSSVFSFARQILNAALDWRDTMQAELPGFRDRICQIHLSKLEGGLNLDMPEQVVEALEARGQLAGDTIVNDFRWDCHLFARYLTLMQVMQDGLTPAQLTFARFEEQVPDIPPDCPDYPNPEPPEWDVVKPLTSDFLAAMTWGPGRPTDFDEHAPTPKGWVRVTPRV
jgi:predicted acylesterase/phospholipase RssA